MSCGSGPTIDDTDLRHVLVIDIGGGTSDFSLFELRLNEQSSMPDIKRVAVSEHILLGGDNIDLAIAHMVEPRLAGPGGQISGPQWDHLVASCREPEGACVRRHRAAGRAVCRCDWPVAGQGWSPARRQRR